MLAASPHPATCWSVTDLNAFITSARVGDAGAARLQSSTAWLLNAVLGNDFYRHYWSTVYEVNLQNLIGAFLASAARQGCRAARHRLNQCREAWRLRPPAWPVHIYKSPTHVLVFRENPPEPRHLLSPEIGPHFFSRNASHRQITQARGHGAAGRPAWSRTTGRSCLRDSRHRHAPNHGLQQPVRNPSASRLLPFPACLLAPIQRRRPVYLICPRVKAQSFTLFLGTSDICRVLLCLPTKRRPWQVRLSTRLARFTALLKVAPDHHRN